MGFLGTMSQIRIKSVSRFKNVQEKAIKYLFKGSVYNSDFISQEKVNTIGLATKWRGKKNLNARLIVR